MPVHEHTIYQHGNTTDAVRTIVFAHQYQIVIIYTFVTFKKPVDNIRLLTSLIMMRHVSLSLWQFPTVEFPEKQGVTCLTSKG